MGAFGLQWYDPNPNPNLWVVVKWVQVDHVNMQRISPSLPRGGVRHMSLGLELECSVGLQLGIDKPALQTESGCTPSVFFCPDESKRHEVTLRRIHELCERTLNT